MEWLPLFDGSSLAKWWIDNPDTMELQDGVLVMRDGDMRAEVGGESWEDYVLAAEVMVTCHKPDAYYQLELTAVGSCVYCQLLPGHIVLAYYSKERNGTAHFGKGRLTVTEGLWHQFQMRAEAGRITALFDGQEIASGVSPLGSRGMAGLVVKFIRDAELRVRNIRIGFLHSTQTQLSEYAADACINWLRHKESQKPAQQPDRTG